MFAESSDLALDHVKESHCLDHIVVHQLNGCLLLHPLDICMIFFFLSDGCRAFMTECLMPIRVI